MSDSTNVTRLDSRREEDERMLTEFGYDLDEVGVQLAANLHHHHDLGQLQTDAEGISYGLGFVEGLLHAKTGRLDSTGEAVNSMLRAIAEHRTAIRTAGEVRVDERDHQVVEAKRRADEQLWAVADACGVNRRSSFRKRTATESETPR